jgi:hypothetical protein
MKITPKFGLLAIMILAITMIMATSTLALSTIDTYEGCTTAVALDGNYAYCGDGTDLLKIDTSTMTLSDTYSGSYEYSSQSKPVISGDYIFINSVGDQRMLKINKNTMSLSNNYAAPDMTYAPLVHNGYVYFLTANRQMYQLTESSLSYVTNVQVTSNYNEGTFNAPIVVEPDPIGAPGLEVIFGGGAALQLNPLSILVTYTGYTGYVKDMKYLNGYTYIATSSGQFRKYDWITGTLNATQTQYSGAEFIETDGTYIYTANGYYIRKFDQSFNQLAQTTEGSTSYPWYAPFEKILLLPDGTIISGSRYYEITYEIDSNDLTTTSNVSYGASAPMTLASDNTTIYIPGYNLTKATTNDCVPNWTCSDYADCDSEDEQKCNSTIDTNACGETYTGDYSEFTPLTCDFCTPDWTCKTYEQCVRPATTASCNSVTDENSCSEPYTGNYSEFTPTTCTYGGGSGIPADDDDDKEEDEKEDKDGGENKDEAPLLSIGGLSSEFDVNKQTIKDVLTILAGAVLLVIIYYITKPKGKSKRKKK